MREYPVVYLWYGKKAYRPIEEIMKDDVDYFFWLLEKFQNVTVEQAEYFKGLYGADIPNLFIENVKPYEYLKGDPEELYLELCKFPRPDLEETLRKYRKVI